MTITQAINGYTFFSTTDTTKLLLPARGDSDHYRKEYT